MAEQRTQVSLCPQRVLSSLISWTDQTTPAEGDGLTEFTETGVELIASWTEAVAQWNGDCNAATLWVAKELLYRIHLKAEEILLTDGNDEETPEDQDDDEELLLEQTSVWAESFDGDADTDQQASKLLGLLGRNPEYRLGHSLDAFEQACVRLDAAVITACVRVIRANTHLCDPLHIDPRQLRDFSSKILPLHKLVEQAYNGAAQLEVDIEADIDDYEDPLYVIFPESKNKNNIDHVEEV